MLPTQTASPQMATMSSHALPVTDVPSGFEEMMALARALANADAYIPDELQGKPANMLALMMRARALDIPLAVAWDELYRVDSDGVGQRAKLVRALARRAGHRLAYVAADDHHAVVLIQLAGETTHNEVSFTIQEAHNLGLTDPETGGKAAEGWLKQPKNMLIARVTTRAVNWYCPEVMLGLGSDITSAIEIDSDVITAYQEEHKAKVTEALRTAEDLEKEPDGKTRLDALRELFTATRDAGTLDFAADDTGEYSVRRVLMEKMKAADQLAKEQQADPEYSREKAIEAMRAAEEAEAAADGDGEKTAKKTAAKKTVKKTAAKKTTRKAAAKKTVKTSADAPSDSSRTVTQPGGKEAGKPGGKEGSDRCLHTVEGATARPDDRTLPCGCVVDEVIEKGHHGEACGGGSQ